MAISCYVYNLHYLQGFKLPIMVLEYNGSCCY
jgi:hypothetical protein